MEKMQTEMQALEIAPSFMEDPKYTSLKDIISYPATYDMGSASLEKHGFGTSNIAIRNQLVKKAASAYLQSAFVLSGRDWNCLTGLWRRVRNRRAWKVYIENPARSCAGFVARTVYRLMTCMVNQVLWITGGTTSIA